MKRNKKEDPTVQEPNEENEVVVWGDVSLTEDELELLNLVPGYMVVADLNREEMLVEENVTMTKIRWSRMKSGDEELTGKQIDQQECDEPENELQNEAQDEIELESRDVISSDGKRS